MKLFSKSIVLSVVMVGVCVSSSLSDVSTPDGESPMTTPTVVTARDRVERFNDGPEKTLRRRRGQWDQPQVRGFSKLVPNQDKKLIRKPVYGPQSVQDNLGFSEGCSMENIAEKRVVAPCRGKKEIDNQRLCRFVTCFFMPMMYLVYSCGSEEPGCLGMCSK